MKKKKLSECVGFWILFCAFVIVCAGVAWICLACTKRKARRYDFFNVKNTALKLWLSRNEVLNPRINEGTEVQTHGAIRIQLYITSNVLSKRSSIISHRSSKVDRNIDVRSSKVNTSIFEGRHIDLRKLTHRFSKVDTSIVDLRRSTHRSPKVDISIFENGYIDLRRLTHRSSKIEGGNIAPTIRHRILSTTALHILKVLISGEVTHAHTCVHYMYIPFASNFAHFFSTFKHPVLHYVCLLQLLDILFVPHTE